MSDFAVHRTATIVGETGSNLSRTRASLAPAKPVLRILDRIDPLAKLAMNGKLRFHATVPEISNPNLYSLTTEL
jgi:hypothetical protein